MTRLKCMRCIALFQRIIYCNLKVLQIVTCHIKLTYDIFMKHAVICLKCFVNNGVIFLCVWPFIFCNEFVKVLEYIYILY